MKRLTLPRLAFISSLLISIACAQESISPDCGKCATRISAIQGPYASRPIIPVGEKEPPPVVVEAIVTANASQRLKGFFIQEPQTNEDNEPLTSEGVFVYSQKPELKPGDRVRIRGRVQEHYGQTQLVPEKIDLCGKDALDQVRIAKPPRNINLQKLERYEGMLVNFSGKNALTVTKNYSFDYASRRNTMDLSHGGPLFKPTQLHPPLSKGAKLLAAANNQNRITLITDEKRQTKGRIHYYPSFGPTIHYIRGGDTITNLTAVVTYRHGRYQLLPIHNLDSYAFNRTFSQREGWPASHQYGELRIASFNVLNYFNTVQHHHKQNPLGDNRGAKSLGELMLQREKIAEAITRLDADIVGLMELENNGFGPGSAIDDLLEAVNRHLPELEQYKAVTSYGLVPIGTDAITVGIIYKPSKVSLQGSVQILPMPEQHFTLHSTDGKKVSLIKSMRPSLLQTFHDASSGKKLTVVVNHFKSKGSMCYEDYMEYADQSGKVPLDGTRIKKGSKPTAPNYQDDLQGSCNELRVAAAKQLGDHIKRSPFEHILLIGDFNAYGEEDPIRLLTDGQTMQQPVVSSSHTIANCQGIPQQTLHDGYGLTNLAKQHLGKSTNKPISFSYSYDGELGALDHAIASKALAKHVTHVQEWHINSLENKLFEYSGKYSGDLPKDQGPFRSSDHDPLLIDIDLSR